MPGVTIPCPVCNYANADINIHVWEGGGSITCGGCGKKFTKNARRPK